MDGSSESTNVPVKCLFEACVTQSHLCLELGMFYFRPGPLPSSDNNTSAHGVDLRECRSLDTSNLVTSVAPRRPARCGSGGSMAADDIRTTTEHSLHDACVPHEWYVVELRVTNWHRFIIIEGNASTGQERERQSYVDCRTYLTSTSHQTKIDSILHTRLATTLWEFAVGSCTCIHPFLFLP